jgi:Domain of unknown function (DUF3390)
MPTSVEAFDFPSAGAKKTGWIQKLPKIAAGWTQVRDMPAPARRTFHQIWKDRK